MQRLINILLRVTFRPNFFEECIKSIISQNYENLNIICCYDDPLCLKYLKNYKHIVNYYFIKKESNDKYFYNLYCNDLLKKVNSGWIIFLDDDDKFHTKTALSRINKRISNDNDIIFWKFKIKAKEIYPRNINKIQSGQIANSSYCFHSKYRNKAQWISTQTGDYHFINTLLKKYNLNRIFINLNLTGSIWSDSIKYGNEGKKFVSTDFSKFFEKYYLEDIECNFDKDYYLKNNPDLINIKNPLNHWNKYGRYEYRHCSDQYSEKIKETIEIAKKKYEELTR